MPSVVGAERFTETFTSALEAVSGTGAVSAEPSLSPETKAIV